MNLLRHCLGCVLLLAAVTAAADVHIRETGLQGYVASSGPQQLRVEISNPSQTPESFMLRISQIYFRRTTSHIDYRVDLEGGSSRLLEIPVLIGDDAKLRVEQINAGGDIISSDAVETAVDRSELVAVVCGEQAVCRAVSDAIRAASTVEEQNTKEQTLKIVLLTNPPRNWFGYAPVRRLVIAGPIQDVAVRNAIENFVRFGGDAIIVANQAPSDLFAAYRAPNAKAVAMGRGTLRVAESAAQLRQFLVPEKNVKITDLVNFKLQFSEEIGDRTLMQWVGTQFVFPRLRWLIGWMIVYTLLVGLVNFFVLRRIGRIELGWLTVPAIAILFAGLFYSLSVRGKMTRFSLDDVSVCYMDDKSPVGVVNHSFRVASPQVRDLVFQAPVSAVVYSAGQDPLFSATAAADIWDENSHRRNAKVAEMMVDSVQHLPLEMLRLSYRDLNFGSVREFSGTVSMKEGILTNATGQGFSQAALIDFRIAKFYNLGPLPAGERVQPFTKPAQDMNKQPGFFQRAEKQMQGAFTLSEFLQSGNFIPHFKDNPLVFVGFTEAPLLAGKLEGIEPDHKVYTVFLVALEDTR